MKKLTILLLPMLAAVLFLSAGCKKKGGNIDKNVDPDSLVIVTSEDGKGDITGVPALITNTSAGCYELQDDGSMKYVTSLEQYTEVLYLGEIGEFTYYYNDEERSADFMKCYMEYNDEMTTLWILKFNVMENASLGVVLNTNLLYSKDKMDKITDKEAAAGTIVFKDASYKAKKFERIRVPELGAKDYYIQISDFSSSESDIQVAMLYHAALKMEEGKEKLKKQLLQDAVDSFPSSPLINLVYNELNAMDGMQSGAVDESDMGNDEDEAGMGDDFGM